MAPSLLQVTFVFFLPKSPRFLVSKDRHEEALLILVEYHADRDDRSESVRAETAEIKTTVALELEHARRSWLDTIGTTGMRRRVLLANSA